ncbi:MAG: hypothetical protein JXA57_13160 [Armatimonadetes bacterium]|nr:hypothetical protein [Armatimonadota bacterium]
MKRWPKRKSWSPHRRASAFAVPLRAIAWLAAALFSLALSAAWGAGEPKGETSPTLIISLPQATWSQFRAWPGPSARKLTEEGAVALMPAAAPSDGAPNHTWVTVGAGRAAAGAEVRGEPRPGGGFQIEMAPLLTANREAHTSARPGLLGTRLHELGLRTAAIGFAGKGSAGLPQSFATVVDEQGIIDGGALRPVDFTGLGLAISREAVEALLSAALAEHDVIFLDLTGLSLDAALDEALASAMEAVGARGGVVLAICGLSPAHPDPDHRSLGYLVWWPAPEGRSGVLLTSPMTRWKGIVTAADVAPTILDHCSREAGVEVAPLSEGMSGRTLAVAPAKSPLARADQLDLMLSEKNHLRKTAGVVWGVFFLILALAAFVLDFADREEFRWLAIPALIAVLFPIGLLLAPLAGMGQARQLLVAAAVALGGALLASLLPRVTQSLAAALLAGAGIIVVDIVTGSHLMRQSAFGFSVLWGARFYGLGNEYAGLLGGLVTVGLGALVTVYPRRTWFARALGLVVLVVVGAPWWGANWGGYVAVAAGLIGLWVWTRPRRGRAALLGTLLLLTAAVLPAAVDLLRPATDRTHIGLAAEALLSGHARMVAEVIQRKIAMNGRIAAQAGWWWAAAVVPLLATQALLRRAGRAQAILSRERLVAAGFMGAVVTAGVAMVVNDSGVVSFATSLAVAFGALVFVAARGR